MAMNAPAPLSDKVLETVGVRPIAGTAAHQAQESPPTRFQTRWRPRVLTPKDAQQLIETLAGGIDPETGEMLPADSPLNSTRVVRALFLAAKALDERGGKRDRPRADAANAGKPWAEEEDRQLAAAFDAGMTVVELTLAHGRTRGAIHSRLIRLGRLQPGRPPAA
jgi:hypothetical protein